MEWQDFGNAYESALPCPRFPNSFHYSVPKFVETEKGFSQMKNIFISIQSNFTIRSLLSPLFIINNGPPPYLWNTEKAFMKWLLFHISASNGQTKKRTLTRSFGLNELQTIVCILILQTFFCHGLSLLINLAQVWGLIDK